MKALLIILDGLGDRAQPELGHKTPLQFASTPNLDKLAALGMNGLMYSLAPGIAPATELAHFALFGYSLSDFPGRAVLEAVGEGLDLSEKTVVLRASFASVEERGKRLVVVDRVVDAEEEILSLLAEQIEQKECGEISIEFVYNSRRQGILYLKGEASKEVTDSDPFANDKPVAKVEALEEAKEYKKAVRTAECLNQYLRWTYHKLNKHPLNEERRNRGLRPINFLVTKWAGLRKKLPSFYEMYGFKGAAVASNTMLKGFATEIGLDFLAADNLDDAGEDLDNRLGIARDALNSEYDFVHVHTKAPDDAAHKKSPLLKAEVIEKSDCAFGSFFFDSFVKDDVLVVVTADHSTPSAGALIHSGEPVPIIFVGRNVRCDDVREFNELACLDGAVGQIAGSDLMHLVLNFTDRIKYSGSRITSKNVPHYPVDINYLEK